MDITESFNQEANTSMTQSEKSFKTIGTSINDIYDNRT